MDDYLAGLAPDQRAALEHVRTVVHGTEPGTVEGKSYGMPAFIYAERPLLAFRAAKNHLSIFPFSPAAIRAVKGRLSGHDLSKGTIRFSPDSPVPDDVIADLIRHRKQEITSVT
ncbi:MAG: DUF1801 domain-containing protein [Actinomycetota bacterium]|nr:DUF1801 domain-containing protein [Actinomycetota bacterium]